MKYHQCEWCEASATYKIVCETIRHGGKPYQRFSCGDHGRKMEQLVDLDLGNGAGAPIRRHTTASEPFLLEPHSED